MFSEKNIRTRADVAKYSLFTVVMLVAGFAALVQLATMPAFDLVWMTMLWAIGMTAAVLDVIGGCYLFACIGTRLLLGLPGREHNVVHADVDGVSHHHCLHHHHHE